MSAKGVSVISWTEAMVYGALFIVELSAVFVLRSRKLPLTREIEQFSSRVDQEQMHIRKIKQSCQKLDEIVNDIGILRSQNDIASQQKALIKKLQGIIGGGKNHTQCLSFVEQKDSVELFFECVIFTKTLAEMMKIFYEIEKTEEPLFVDKWELSFEKSKHKGVFLIRRIFMKGFS